MSEKDRNSSNFHDYETPKWFFSLMSYVFGQFVLDAAASEDNHLCPHYLTKEQDALETDWSIYRDIIYRKSVWINPPYGQSVLKWVNKAIKESRANQCRIALLLGSGGDQQWYQAAYDHAFALVQIIHRLHFSVNGIPQTNNTRSNGLYVIAPITPFQPAIYRVNANLQQFVDRDGNIISLQPQEIAS